MVLALNKNNIETIICPECKKETGQKGENIIKQGTITDYYCPHCGKLVFSSLPQIKKYTSYINTSDYKGSSSGGGYQSVYGGVQGVNDDDRRYWDEYYGE